MTCTTLQCRNNILGRRLEQCDDIADELLAALDVAKRLDLIVTNVNAALDICGLQNGLVARLAELLDYDGGSLSRLGEHDRRRTLQYVHQISLGLLHLLQSLAEQRILNYDEFDAVLKALATQRCGLLGVKSLDVGNIEVRVLIELLCKTVDNGHFLFSCHLYPPSLLRFY